MSKRTYTGGSFEIIPREWRGSITTTTNAHTYTLDVTDEAGNVVTFTYTLANPPETTTTLAAAAFATAWNASADPRIKGIVASNDANAVILTADAPFNVGNEGGTGTWASTGYTELGANPEDVAYRGNFIENIAPVAGDNITIVSGNLTYGLQRAADWTAEVIFAKTFSGTVGAQGTPLDITPTVFVFDASGTGKAFFDFNAAAIPLQINSTGAPTTGYGFNISNGTALTTVTINGGSVGFALGAGETFTAATIENNGGTVEVGNTTGGLTNFLQSSGTATINCAGTTLAVTGGTVTTQGAVAWGTLSAKKSGRIISNASGTVTSAVADDGGVVDFLRSRVARTLTAGSAGFNGAILAEQGVLTITNGVQPLGAIALKGVTP